LAAVSSAVRGVPFYAVLSTVQGKLVLLALCIKTQSTLESIGSPYKSSIHRVSSVLRILHCVVRRDTHRQAIEEDRIVVVAIAMQSHAISDISPRTTQIQQSRVVCIPSRSIA
jgi:hypothetical protein